MATIDSLTLKPTPLTTDTIELNDGLKGELGSLPVSTAQTTAINSAVATHAALTSTHGSTALATPSRIAERDAAGAVAFAGLDLDTVTIASAFKAGRSRWNDTVKCWEIDLEAGTTLQVGQENLRRVRNSSGSTLLNGAAVYINGATGNLPTIALAQANSLTISSRTIGLITTDPSIANNANGFVCISGTVNGLNTSAYVDGDVLYLRDDVAGGLSTTAPTAEGSAVVVVGIVVRAHGTLGAILVRTQYLGSVTGYGVVNSASKTAARTAISAAADDLSNTGAQAALARTAFPSFRATWNKLADMGGSSATGQLRYAAFLDSLGVENGAQKFIAPHLRTLYGFAGMITPVGFAGGSFPVAFNGAAVNGGTDYTVSPFGKYVEINASGEGIGLYLGNGSVGYYPFATPQNSPYGGTAIDNVVVYYTKESGAGEFKVQITVDGSVWTDVVGLTAVSADNATTALGIATASFTSQYVKGVRALWVSGAVKIIAAGGWHSTNPGIIQIESSVGGMDTADFCNSPLTTDWMDSINPEFYTFSARDGATTADPVVIAANIALFQTLLPAGAEGIYYGIPQAATDSEEVILAYDSAVREGAEAVGAYFLSYYQFATYAEANALGWMSGVHPTNEFSSRLAAASLLAIGISLPIHGIGKLGSIITLPRLNSVPSFPDNGVRLSADSELGFIVQGATNWLKFVIPAANRTFTFGTSGQVISTDSNTSDRTTLPGQLWISMSNAREVLNNTGGATNEKIWDWRASGVTLAGRVVNDADSAAANWVLVNRVGASVQAISFPAPVTLGSGGTQVTRIKHGTATLVAGTVTVSDTSITANSRIFPTRFTDGGTVGASYSITRSAGASFTITAKDGAGANQASDTSVIAYQIIEP